jgi:mannose-6-phosphate isomerase-like protein (cupin superfamily)
MPEIPADDGVRGLALAAPDDEGLPHIAVVGDTYTVLISTAQTAGRYCLIDMLIPGGGGPPPHRHDFEEMFHVLSGSVEVTLRGEVSSAAKGQTVNIPANAPHSFRNPTDEPLRLLCLAAPGGLDEYFEGFGDRVASRTSPAPRLSEPELAERMRRAGELAPRYRIDMLGAAPQ